MRAMNAEIHCPGCGRESLLMRKPKYDGFKRVGEELTCAACGYAFAAEAEVPFKQARKIAIFTDDDKPRVVDVFKDDPRHRLCRYCLHYVVNPFRQWCGLHRRDVQATDTCDRFKTRPEPAAGPDDPPAGTTETKPKGFA